MQEKVSLNLQQHLVGLILQLCGDCGWSLDGEVAWGMIFLRFSCPQCESSAGNRDKSHQLDSAGPSPEQSLKERLEWLCA